MQRARMRRTYRDVAGDTYCLSLFLSFSFSFFSLLFFLATYCRVECNFLTLKISGWGAPTFRRQTGCRSRCGRRAEGWDDAENEREQKRERRKGREREREKIRVCAPVCICGVRANENEKKSRLERKDYIGDFGFRVSSGRKADFPIFRLSRDESQHSN